MRSPTLRYREYNPDGVEANHMRRPYHITNGMRQSPPPNYPICLNMLATPPPDHSIRFGVPAMGEKLPQRGFTFDSPGLPTIGGYPG